MRHGGICLHQSGFAQLVSDQLRDQSARTGIRNADIEAEFTVRLPVAMDKAMSKDAADAILMRAGESKPVAPIQLPDGRLSSQLRRCLVFPHRYVAP